MQSPYSKDPGTEPRALSLQGVVLAEWRTVADPKNAGWLFSQGLLESNRSTKCFYLCMDIRQDREDQDRALLTFYKNASVQWASPVECRLRGDVATGNGVQRHMMSTVIFKLRCGFHLNLGEAAVTKVFDGEPDHLVPATSEVLVAKEMFRMAGRMIGHSFLHGGPGFPGVSPAILHVLFGDSPETATPTIEDCPDIDLRHTLKILEGEAEIENMHPIVQLCVTWNLPPPNATNRKWLFGKLLLHAVVGQTMLQTDQLRKGIKETGIWPLLIQRRDVIPLLFPRESEAQITSQMLLDAIIWPSSITVIFESYREIRREEDDDEDICRVSGYLRTFIENASVAELKSLIKFWTGWEVPAREMTVEIVDANLPTSLTCFEKLRLPRHYTSYKTFQEELRACMATSYSGFGRA